MIPKLKLIARDIVSNKKKDITYFLERAEKDGESKDIGTELTSQVVQKDSRQDGKTGGVDL